MIFSLALCGLFGVSLWLRFAAPGPPEPARIAARRSSIAVLPFVNATPDSSNDYLGYGFAGELTRALRQLPGLRVAPRSSAFAVGRQTREPGVVGRRLGVDAVLQGSVLRAPDRLRITAQLVDVNEGFDLWSETYERKPADLLAIQDQIEQALAGVLRVPLEAGREVAPSGLTRHPAAYDAYLAARHLLDQLTPETARRAIAYLTWAIHLDPNFGLAHAALGQAHLRRSGVDGVAPRVAVPLARTAALRAMVLDSTLAEPHVLLGSIQFGYDRDWRGAEEEFRRAVALEPDNPDVYPPYARFLLAMGRSGEAAEASRRALQLSPAAPRLLEQLGWHHLHTRQYPPAREALWRAVALDSSAWRPRFQLALVEQALGNFGEAATHLEGPLRRAPERSELQAALGQIYAASGRSADARTILVQLLDASRQRYVSPYVIATLQAALGQRRQAFASLDRAVAERSELIGYLRIDPRVDSLRTDPRFDRLLRRVRLP